MSETPKSDPPGSSADGSAVAIIGMACRFPGAGNIEDFWRNLCNGVESLSWLSDEDLKRSRTDPALLRDPSYVRRAAVVDQIEEFDAELFGYTPLEAKIMDPQHRLLIECAWEAFEQAGYHPERHEHAVGVFTGAKTNTYLLNLFSNRELFDSLDRFQIALGNDLACLATRLSYKLDLRGPSYALHTACSTSLVAVHLACQSLLLDECRMALAGAVAVNVPQRTGYRYQKGGILSPDGSSRTFDERAAGCLFGNGAGVVLLKRLDDALADGDHVYAIIRGSATNNDGAQKASFTAPGVEGQIDVLLEAMACAGIEAASLSYIEAHGTATELGDSIEMLALSSAFRASTEKKGFCAIGSVKTNLGHLETAAGMAGLIKTALALDRGQIPPSLHCEKPNPRIDFAASPFYVQTELSEWPAGEGPRRAGVSSFGIGSTNAHVILEQAPPAAESGESRRAQLLLLSARTATALERMTGDLAEHLKAHSELRLADVAFTLQVGRKDFPCRRALVCRSVADAGELLSGGDPQRVFTHVQEAAAQPVAFLFPGLGEHYLGMGLGLYRSEPTFRATVDRCAELLRSELGSDLREVLYPRGSESAGQSAPAPGRGPDLRRMLGRDRDQPEAAAERLNQTSILQPVMFTIELALAQLWMEWGVRPRVMIGYSLGEYVAACVAGVLSAEDALILVAKRAQMIQELPAGAMLAVPMSAEELGPLLAAHELSLAAANGPSTSVAAGAVGRIEALAQELAAREVVCRRLPSTHAFHSRMMEPIAAALTELVRSFELKPPQIPYVSNVTGTWITAEQATDPSYWARHMCEPVRFGDGVLELVREGGRILLEVGPGQGLASFVKQHPAIDAEATRVAVASLRNAYTHQDDQEFLLAGLGRLWLAGLAPDWLGFYARERRRRVVLPTYPFERRRHWVDPPGVEPAPATGSSAAGHVTLAKQADLADWFYRPTWQRSVSEEPSPARDAGLWLVFSDGGQLASALVARLRQAGTEVVRVAAGPGFAACADREYAIDPRRPEDYELLLRELRGRDPALKTVVHLWSLSSEADAGAEEDVNARIRERGFYSLLYLAQALGKAELQEPVHVEVVSAGIHRVTGDERLCPEKATVLGPSRVIPQEFARITCRNLDVVAPDGSDDEETLLTQLVAELARGAEAAAAEPVVALRGGERWLQEFAPCRLEELPGPPPQLREEGVYLLTGGLGGLGLEVAEYLARTVRARLVLTGRTPLPEREAWDEYLAAHDAGAGTSIKIRRIRELEALGAEVLAAAVDVTDAVGMGELLSAARERFGTIHGVVHIAGIPGGGIMQLKTREMAERTIAPKVEGARVLERLLRGGEVDFLVIFSSVASILGEFGQADYCGANAFLDALAEEIAARGALRAITVNWDMWSEVGLAVYTEVPPDLQEWRREMLSKAIRPAEGVEAFGRLLGCGLARVVVSAQDLAGRIELGRSFTGESFLRELGLSRPAAAAGQRVLGTDFVAAGGNLERRLAEIWQRVLGIDQVGVNDNFFDLGGNSLIGLQLVSEIGVELGVQIAPVTLFELPTVRTLARHLNPEPAPAAATDELAARRAAVRQGGAGREIAIIGMTGRFPGAPNLDELWRNLCAGVESVTFFSDQDLLAAGIDPELFNRPNYVRAGAVLEEIDCFDAALFGYSPREAEVMDPQHRVFLECAWEALEKAGYDSSSYPGSVGVFAGSNLSTYLLRMYADREVRASVNMLQAILGNDKDSLTTTVSYKLNLRGPSVAVQTFCSTSLVAVHMACQSLRQGECDMALAGGIRIVVPDRQGYLYEEGGISPADGHSRSFDAAADGSILGQGVGIVVLKRLADAVADGDPIHAVIKGTAINNDGSLKAGYTAPSVAGQSAAVIAAYEDAGVDPETMGYVEAHGSATKLGDPIEMAALTAAYRTRTDKVGFCRVGSVKSNFGHLDRAAGVTGLIKTVLALEHAQIPPSINYQKPNPEIAFASSPFRVNDVLWEWRTNGAPRRAAVNSLGIGGTNVHVVLEEAPAVEPSGESRPWQLLLLSAKTDSALGTATANLAAHLKSHPDLNLADAAYTLQVGRRDLPYRRTAVCRDGEDAAATLEGAPRRLLSAYCEEGERTVVFMFPGLGGQYVNMARGLYRVEPRFREEFDRCAEILTSYLGCDLREVIYPESSGDETGDETSGERQVDLRQMLRRDGAEEDDPATARLNQTRLTQPALFVVEYALAQLWMEWGIRPQALIGYSLGEYVAACLAGVLSLADALRLVAERARMIGELPGGAMLAVALCAEEVLELLGEELSLSAVNGPEQSVVAGPPAAIAALERQLAERDVASRRLKTSHAFHSRMMDPLAAPLAALVAGLDLRAPAIPYLSNLTGKWITAAEATDPSYWARHMCQPVRFSDSVAELCSDPQRILFEVGPGQTLATLILQHPASAAEPAVLAALRHSYERQPDVAHALNALGKLWLLGVEIDWKGFYRHERRRRLELPTYPFERQRYWIDTVDDGDSPGRRTLSAAADGRGRFYLPSWRRAPLAAFAQAPADRQRWLVFVDEVGLGTELAERLAAAGRAVTTVRTGESFDRLGEGSYRLDPRSPHHYAALLAALAEPPQGIVHLWSVGRNAGDTAAVEAFRQAQDLGFSSLLALARSLGDGETALWVISDSLHEVSGQEELRPEQATLLGACSVLPREFPGLSCRSVDVLVPDGSREVDRLVGQILAEIDAAAAEPLVAWRGSHRWVPALELLEETPALAAADACPARLRQGGVYLVTNGLGTPGHRFAEYLVTTVGARLVLVEPPGFPSRDKWDEWLLSDDGEGLISHRIRQVKAWEEAGAELLVAGVDFADSERLRELLAEAEERFGAIHGLIHVAEPAAGAAEGDDGGHLRTAHRLLVLEELLRDKEPDCCFLVSPPTSTDGGPTAAQAAAGFFMDAFASYGSGVDPGRWTSVTWEMPEGTDHRVARALFSLAPVAQVVVSPRSLDAGWTKFEAFREEAAEAPERSDAVGAYPRPSLRVEYVAPRDETEEKIAEIWQELLGVAQVGVHDNFLELGGDSLLASRMVTRMREIFQVELPIRLLFAASTVAELGRALEEIRQQETDREMQEMLETIKGLSEEELERELTRRAEMTAPGEET